MKTKMKPQTQKSPQKAFTQGERHLSTWEIYLELGKTFMNSREYGGSQSCLWSYQ